MTAQSAIPLKWYVPFATGDASRVEIPVTSSDATRASQTLGFPPLTMQPPAVGGVPPQGEDFNGAMNQVARIAWWSLNGGGWPYDATFATNSNIGGYPNGAVLQSADFLGQWISTADNNQNNPDTSGTSWVPGYQYGSTALTGQTGGTTTLTPLQAAKRGITISGALTSALVVILPAWVKDWSITNNTTGAYTVIVKTASGSGVTIPQNSSPTPVSGDGTNITQLAQNIAAATQTTHPLQLGQATGRLLNVQVFTSSGTYTPFSSLVTSVIVEVVGGGGSGGGSPACNSSQLAAGGGAGSGAYAKVRLTSGFTGGIAVTVGAGGVASTGGGNGNNGGNSSFGSIITCSGGGAGVGGTAVTGTASTAGGIPGTIPTITSGVTLVSSKGTGGGVGAVIGGSGYTVSGAGAAGPFGGGASGVGGTAVGQPGGGPGAGSSGAATNNSGSAVNSGAGYAGLVVVYEYA